MYDLICLGTLAVDMYFKGNALNLHGKTCELTLGDKYFVDEFHVSLGGGGANVAVGVQKHGLRTALIAKIGLNSFRKMILDKLEENNVSHLYCQYAENYLNISSILLADSGERSVINYQTHHQHFIATESDLDKFSRAKAVFLGNLPDVSLTERLQILRFVQKNNVYTFLNIGIKDCQRPIDQLEQIFSHTNVLILNRHEFAAAMKKSPHELDFKTDVRTLTKSLQDKVLIVTDGDKGSYGYFEEEIVHQPALQAKIVDATGAGDGYTAAFIAEYLKTRDVKRAMQQGAHYAVKILGIIGANEG